MVADNQRLVVVQQSGSHPVQLIQSQEVNYITSQGIPPSQGVDSHGNNNGSDEMAVGG